MGSEIPEDRLTEQLFLDYSIRGVQQGRFGSANGHWAPLYADAICDRRYGDAVWARYHFGTNVEKDIVDGSSSMTVLEVIKKDALSHRASSPEEYFKTVSFYFGTSKNNGHSDVLDIVYNLDKKEIADIEAKKNRRIKLMAYREAIERERYVAVSMLLCEMGRKKKNEIFLSQPH